MSSKQRLMAGLLILLVAAFLRLWQFERLPPGLQHDEVFKAQEAVRLIDQRDFRIFYPTNQGHEGGFVWLLGLSYLIVGINTLMIKFPAFACGMLTVALIFRFGVRRYSAFSGIIASGLAAVSFWHIFVSRVGLRAGMLPVVVLLVLIGMAKILDLDQGRARWRASLLTGIALGCAIYTYTASFTLYLAYAAFVLALYVLRFELARRIWRELLLVGGVAALLALPMVQVRLSNPLGLNRAASIAQPLQDALESRPQTLIDNGWKLLGMPAFVGDPTWRYNIPGRPLFLLPIGLLVYLGLFLAALRSRNSPINILLVGISIFGLLPSLVTVLAPSFLRSIAVLPSVMIFVGIAAAAIAGRFANRRRWAWILATLVLAGTAMADYRAYFVDWEQSLGTNPVSQKSREQGSAVQEIYRDDLQQLATYLGARAESLAFASTPNPRLDPLLYAFSAGQSRERTQIVFFDAFANIVLSDQPTLLFVSPFSPVSEKHRHWLTETYGTARFDPILRQDGAIAFEVYQVGQRSQPLATALETSAAQPVFAETPGGIVQLEFPVQFGGYLLLHGLTVPRTTVYSEKDGVNNQLYFEPIAERSGATLNVFLHLIDQKGNLLAQRDLLGVPPANWRAGIIFIQDNFVPFTRKLQPGVHHLYLGLYDWQSGERIPALDSEGSAISDRIYLGEISVVQRP